ETKLIDSIATTLISGQYAYDPPAGTLPSVDMQYSENVFAGLYNTYFDAYNNTIGHNYGYPLWTYTYDSGTNTVHYTFSGLPGGVLPDGNYTADTGRVTDLYGNTMPSYTSP